jgi:acyl-coenzyme A thioesterase PaaI-like protein
VSVAGFFSAEAVSGVELLHPTSKAAGTWAAGSTIRGPAISAVMARAAERIVAPETGLRPARWTLDLSRPVPMAASTVRAEVVRAGRRLRLVDVQLVQDGEPYAWARALFLRGGGAGAGLVWSPANAVALPPEGLRPGTAESRVYFSEEVGWTPNAAPHGNASRKQIWNFPSAVVTDEVATPFQACAAAADLASVVTNWGTEGVAYINADLSMNLARLPRGLEVGVSAVARIAADGLATGTALLHDRGGVIGTSTVSAIGNADRAIDPAARD